MTEYYVSSQAGGGGSGTEGSPWTLQEAVSAVNGGTVSPGDRINIKNDGTYTLTSALTITKAGDWNGSFLWQGYNSIVGDGGRPLIHQITNANIFSSYNIQFHIFKDLKLQGDGSHGAGVKGGYSTILVNIEAYDLLWGVQNCTGINCYIHDNVEYGWYNCFGAYNCISYNNGYDGFYIYDYSYCVNCISKDNGRWQYHGKTSCGLINCISDGGGSYNGIQFDKGSMYINIVCLNHNSSSGKYAIATGNVGESFPNYMMNINFYNCINKAQNLDTIHTYYELDPQFNDPDNFDYTRTGSNLDDKGFSQVGIISGVDYKIDIGIHQRSAEGGGGVSAPLSVHNLNGFLEGA
jgi:hypothetical protein